MYDKNTVLDVFGQTISFVNAMDCPVGFSGNTSPYFLKLDGYGPEQF
jgi:hypothetical protein